MKSKPGAAMVEMGDCYAVDRAISHLNNNFLFNQKLNVWYVSIGLFFLFIQVCNNSSLIVQNSLHILYKKN